MKKFADFFQTADWKQEKHVPVISSEDKVKSGSDVSVNVCVGKEIPHPNTAEHHIVWIDLYFQPEGEKFTVQIGRAGFMAHGASVKGPDSGAVLTFPEAEFKFRPKKSGVLLAASYCNIHGLWESSREITVE